MVENSYKYDISSAAFSEEGYEQMIIRYLSEKLGYEHLYGPDVPRTSDKFNDVFLPGILEGSLKQINPSLPQEAIAEAVLKISSVDTGSLYERNDKFNDYVQSGVEVRYFDGKQEVNSIVSLLDFENPENNIFHVVNQWTFIENSNKRPDVIIFINGIPFVIFELKSPSREEVDYSDAYLQLKQYMNHIPSLFVPNAFCVISDMTQTKVGTITADEDRFTEWKTDDGDYEKTKFVTYDTMLRGMCEKSRLVDIIDNFICYNNTSEKQIKILAGYHQYFAVRKALVRARAAIDDTGKIGVFWHTQGSGKSLSMVFFAHLLNKEFNNPTIVVITDRNDLDNQLYSTFSRCARFLRQTPVQAKSRVNLGELLRDRESGGIIFTTMQKFTETDEALCDRRNVIVMVDEAHRGQYGLIEKMDAEGHIKFGAAKLVRDALPNASYIGFTGTPISTDDKNTREIFGEYIDIYDMTQAVKDNATRPVYYESRVFALNLDEEVLTRLDKEYDAYAETADELSVKRSQRDLGGLDAIFSTPQVVESLCKDIINHYEKSRSDVLTGKALVVAYSRPMAIKIYKKLLELRPGWTDKIGVVMTMANQDPDEWYDICGGANHKAEMEQKFKDDKSDLKIAIVVDMWLTGFDVPSLSTMYLFKPMQGHNLMQAIARVNRVYKGKEGGLVVDYIGVAMALKQAMKDYTQRDKHNYGNMDIAKTAYPKFQDKLDVCRDILHELKYVNKIKTEDSFELNEMIASTVNWLLDVKNSKNCDEFTKQCQLMDQALSLCKSMATLEEQHEAAFLRIVRVQVLRIQGKIRVEGGAESPKEFNARISTILEQAVQSQGTVNIFKDGEVEISLFNEEFLAQIQKMKEKNIALETLKRLIKEQIKTYKVKSVVKAQKFSEILQKNINGYINGMLTNADVIEEMLKMAKEMMADRQEAEAMGFNDEEMAFYDALTRPQAVKDFYSNDQLKAIVHELTDTLRKNSTIDWQKKESARAGMRRAIKRLLKKYKYPPEETAGAMEVVMSQCELWADTQNYDN